VSDTVQMLASLLVVLVAAKVAGELFERLKQPAVIGELLVGIAIGPHALGLVHPTSALQVVSSIGVAVLMFAVGLETRSSEVFKVGRQAMIVAAGGVVLPLAAGYAFGHFLGYSQPEALFVGTALVATSVGITARVLADRGLIATRVARIVLAAAVIDDVLGMLVLSIVTGVARNGLDFGSVALALAEAVAFITIAAVFLPKVVQASEHVLDRLHVKNAPFSVALGVMLGSALLAEAIGLAAIVGAFFAGMAFADGPERWELESRTEPLYEWLVPYFFVAMGMQVDVKLLASPAVLVPGSVLVVIAVITKVVGSGLGMLSEGPKSALAVGVGMVPRGEVGLIVAAVGVRLGLVPQTVYAMIVLVIVVSTLIVPPLLPRLMKGLQPAEEGPTPGVSEGHFALECSYRTVT
jgi:Kef-type K+ transport system membrane component KefB